MKEFLIKIKQVTTSSKCFKVQTTEGFDVERIVNEVKAIHLNDCPSNLPEGVTILFQGADMCPADHTVGRDELFIESIQEVKE